MATMDIRSVVREQGRHMVLPSPQEMSLAAALIFEKELHFTRKTGWNWIPHLET